MIFEAGMAFGRDRERVLFVLLGNVELFTDVQGVHVFRPTNRPDGPRATLRRTLKNLGCPVSENTAWMSQGDFESVVVAPPSKIGPPKDHLKWVAAFPKLAAMRLKLSLHFFRD
jgi:hypothetical protein